MFPIKIVYELLEIIPCLGSIQTDGSTRVLCNVADILPKNYLAPIVLFLAFALHRLHWWASLVRPIE
jgi:hypothetical protein